IRGRWVAGPGAAFFDAVRAGLGGLPLIAEDLGFITPEVQALRERFGLPGMRVLQFAFGSLGREPEQLPELSPENSVVYTGTHDNDTIRGWFCSPPGSDDTRSAAAVCAERQYIREVLGRGDEADLHWAFIEMAFRTRARTAIVPLQDVLGLGSAGRMNTPGRPDGNWRWRYRSGQLTPALQQRLRRLTEQTGRG
ncbi:MAG: 4-alpha-glucanotransferase, partial [Kiritimatiellaeota bacterium]|nr:4-alpha-glucanotransferase [Kiritimatiellota bacterium]